MFSNLKGGVGQPRVLFILADVGPKFDLKQQSFDQEKTQNRVLENLGRM